MDIEQIKNLTGWTDAELASFINESANEGMSQDQIMQEILANAKPSKADVDMFRLGLDPLANKVTVPFKPGYTPEEKADVVIPFKRDTETKNDEVNEPAVEPMGEEIEFPSWLDWRTHTEHVGNSTPEDNGFTDVKKVYDKVTKYNNGVDPIWQLGMIDKAFNGSDALLNTWNSNRQAEKNREAQEAYNLAMKEESKAETDAATAKAKKLEDAKELKELSAQANEQIAKIYDNSGKGKNWADVSELDWTLLANIKNKIADLGGDTSKIDTYLGYKPVTEEEPKQDTIVPESVTNEVEEGKDTPKKPAKPQTTEDIKRDLRNKKTTILNHKPGKNAKKDEIIAYNSKVEKFNNSLGEYASEIGMIEKVDVPKDKIVYKVGDTWAGRYSNTPKLPYSLKWVKTDKKDDQNRTIWKVEAK